MANAHLELVDSAGLGIMIIEADPGELRAELVAVTSVFEPEPSSWTRRRYAVARGTKAIQTLS